MSVPEYLKRSDNRDEQNTQNIGQLASNVNTLTDLLVQKNKQKKKTGRPKQNQEGSSSSDENY